MFHKDLVRSFDSEALSGSVIEAVHRDGDVVRGEGMKAHIFREQLADTALHVFVRAALPRGIGVSEEEVCAELFGDTRELSELFAVAIRL